MPPARARTTFSPLTPRYYAQPVHAKLSEQQRQQLREAFELMDQDNSGAIDLFELEAAVKLLGESLPPRCCCPVYVACVGPVPEARVHGRRTAAPQPPTTPEPPLPPATWPPAGLNLTRDDLEAIVDEVDRDHTGVMEYPEFEEVMTQTLQRVEERKRQEDEATAAAGGVPHRAVHVPFSLMVTAYKRMRLMETLMSNDKEQLEAVLAMRAEKEVAKARRVVDEYGEYDAVDYQPAAEQQGGSMRSSPEPPVIPLGARDHDARRQIFLEALGAAPPVAKPTTSSHAAGGGSAARAASRRAQTASAVEGRVRLQQVAPTATTAAAAGGRRRTGPAAGPLLPAHEYNRIARLVPPEMRERLVLPGFETRVGLHQALPHQRPEFHSHAPDVDYARSLSARGAAVASASAAAAGGPADLAVAAEFAAQYDGSWTARSLARDLAASNVETRFEVTFHNSGSTVRPRGPGGHVVAMRSPRFRAADLTAPPPPAAPRAGRRSGGVYSPSATQSGPGTLASLRGSVRVAVDIRDKASDDTPRGGTGSAAGSSPPLSAGGSRPRARTASAALLALPSSVQAPVPLFAAKHRQAPASAAAARGASPPHVRGAGSAATEDGHQQRHQGPPQSFSRRTTYGSMPQPPRVQLEAVGVTPRHFSPSRDDTDVAAA